MKLKAKIKEIKYVFWEDKKLFNNKESQKPSYKGSNR